MKNSSSRNLAAALLVLSVLAGVASLPPRTYAAGECAQWELRWVTPPTEAAAEAAGRRVSSQFYPGANPARATIAPAVPANLPKGSDAVWECVETQDPAVDTKTETGQATGLCVRAVELAAKFGGFTALNKTFYEKIQTTVLNSTLAYLRKEVFKATKIDINNITKSAFDEAGNFVGQQFDTLVGNPLKGEIQKQKEAIEKEAKKLLGELSDKYAKEAADKLKGAALSLVSTEVPVSAKGAEKELQGIQKKQDQQIAEQKKAELLADTREKCRALLTTTNETIKKAILYQLSTQIVDWIQTGKAPQFVKQPGKFLENTGRLAVDRFISRVAPRLCQSFRPNIVFQIPSVRREDNPFYEQVTCSLDQVVENAEAFYDDFRSGGWLGYQEALKPQNNYYGSLIMTQLAALEEQAKAQEVAKLDLAQGNGYQSERECVKWVRYDFAGFTSTYLASEQYVNGGYYAAGDLSGPTDDGLPPEGSLIEESGMRPVKDSRFWPATTARGGRAADTSANHFWQCEEDRVTRPGNIAAGLATRASQTDLDALAAAQDVGVFLQTIEDAIINKLVKSGVKGLQRLLPTIFQ